MNRDGALAYLNSVMDQAMELVGREITDVAKGYKPALDAAFLLYIERYGLSTGVTDTAVPTARTLCFMALLEAVTYDLIYPSLAATQVDFSIDAPLTNVKYSQAYRALKDARNAAWYRAAACGYDHGVSNVSAFRTNLDFNEPGRAPSAEFA